MALRVGKARKEKRRRNRHKMASQTYGAVAEHPVETTDKKL